MVAIDADLITYTVGFADPNERRYEKTRKHLNDFIKEILVNTRSNQYLGFLTGGDSFRVKLSLAMTYPHKENKIITHKPLVKEYKGCRKGKPKPHFFHELRESMVNDWGFHMLNEIEADDAVCMCAYKYDNCIIASKDKDMKQIPTMHYHIKDKSLTRVNAKEAHYNLYHQIIMGDTSDDVAGIVGMGEAKATKFLANVNPENYHVAVKSLYQDKFNTVFASPGEQIFYVTKGMIELLKEWPNFALPEPINFANN